MADIVSLPPGTGSSKPRAIQSKLAEVALLAGILKNPDNWDVIVGDVSKPDFFDPLNQQIFEAMKMVAEDGAEVDYSHVYQVLLDHGQLNQDMNLRLFDLNGYDLTPNVRDQAEIVRHKGMLRELIATTRSIEEEAYVPENKSVPEILERAEQRIRDISDRGIFNLDEVLLDHYAKDVRQHLETLRTQGHLDSGVESGLADLDKITRGFNKSDLIVLAARPGMGKTSFAVNVTEHLLQQPNKKHRVVFFTMEQPGKQLVMKLIASVSKINHERLINEKLNEEEEGRVESTLLHLADWGNRLIIDDSHTLSIDHIRSRTRTIERSEGKIDLIIVDYLQLVDAGRSDRFIENRSREIAMFTRGLKRIAMDLDVPVLAVSQLNRQSMERKDTRPRLSELRESGAIEQDADMVVMIHREELSNMETTEKGIAELIVAKNRHGRTGMIKVAFIGELTKFENYTARQDDPGDFYG